MKLWWEEIIDMAESCKDLEWLFYNGGQSRITFEGPSEKLCDQSGPVSEQIWAIDEGLA